MKLGRPAGEGARAEGPRGVDGDLALMRRVVDGDIRAFEALYRAYHPRLTRFLLTITRRVTLVEEVLDDTMMTIWTAPERFNGASKLSTWVFAIAYRKALNALRRQDEPVEDPDAERRPSTEPGPERQLSDIETRAALLNALAELSPDHRTVVDLTYFHEMSYREIAEIMSCPVDTVKTRMFHARRVLKRLLQGGRADWL